MKAGTEFCTFLTSLDYFRKQHTKSFRCFCPSLRTQSLSFFLLCYMIGQHHEEMTMLNNSVQNPAKTSDLSFQYLSDLPVLRTSRSGPQNFTDCASFLAARNHDFSSTVAATRSQSKLQKQQSGSELKIAAVKGRAVPTVRETE